MIDRNSNSTAAEKETETKEYFKIELGEIYRGADWEELLASPLEGSIAKWQFIADTHRRGEDIYGCGGRITCPLCAVYYDSSPDPCRGCPVFGRIGEAGCRGTPYLTWQKSPSYETAMEFADWLTDLKMDTVEYLRWVGAELEGLNEDPAMRETVLIYAEGLLYEALAKVINTPEVKDDDNSSES